MIDTPPRMEPVSAPVTLESLLDGSELSFRAAVIAALVQEGFDLDETLPYLHHPLEILEAIGWLKSCGFGEAWNRFQATLVKEGTLGTLVDMSLGRHRYPGSVLQESA